MRTIKIVGGISIALWVLWVLTLDAAFVTGTMSRILIWFALALSLLTGVYGLYLRDRRCLPVVIGGIAFLVGFLTVRASGPDGLGLWGPGAFLVGCVMFAIQVFMPTTQPKRAPSD